MFLHLKTGSRMIFLTGSFLGNRTRGPVVQCSLCKRQVGVRYPVQSYQRLGKWYMIFPRLAFSTLGKSTEVKHTVLPDGQPPTVACTMHAHLCSPKANETEMGATLFTKNGEGRNFDFFYFLGRSEILFRRRLRPKPAELLLFSSLPFFASHLKVLSLVPSKKHPLMPDMSANFQQVPNYRHFDCTLSTSPSNTKCHPVRKYQVFVKTGLCDAILQRYMIFRNGFMKFAFDNNNNDNMHQTSPSFTLAY